MYLLLIFYLSNGVELDIHAGYSSLKQCSVAKQNFSSERKFTESVCVNVDKSTYEKWKLSISHQKLLEKRIDEYKRK